MSSEKLSRNTYHDEQTLSPRAGDVACAEADLDMLNYYRPLERIHASGAHSWGVADGLQVTATKGATRIKVLPGIAIDSKGQHISLAVGGMAEPDPNLIGGEVGPPSNYQSQVYLSGVEISTSLLTATVGDTYLIIQMRESSHTQRVTLDDGTAIDLSVHHHTPWIRLIDVNSFGNDDGTRVVLAQVTLGSGGIVTDITKGLRRAVSLPAQELRLRRNTHQTDGNANNLFADNAESGVIRGRDDGGIELSADKITAQSSGRETLVIDTVRGSLTAGTSGVAGDILVKDGNDRQTISLKGAGAKITVGMNGTPGTNGVAGDILVQDGQNRQTISLEGGTAKITVGGGTEGHEGEILIKNRAGKESVRIDGAKGDVRFTGKLLDPANLHPGVGHDLLKHLHTLTDGKLTDLHQHKELGNATRAQCVHLHSSYYGTIHTVHLTRKQRVFAFIAITSLDIRLNFATAFAQISHIDGVPQPYIPYTYRTVPFFIGQAKDITFLLDSSRYSVTASAVCVVIPEEE